MVDVVLVDSSGNEVGVMERLAAHKNPGALHRAISVLLYRVKQIQSSNDKVQKEIEVLIQQRSELKPLWPGYWANTVCTHPLPQESLLHCAVRRLKEEIGVVMEEGELTPLFPFTYQADYNAELSEHEFDTVIFGCWDGDCQINSDEVSDVRWIEIEELKRDLVEHSELYAPWPKEIFAHSQFQEWLNSL